MKPLPKFSMANLINILISVFGIYAKLIMALSMPAKKEAGDVTKPRIFKACTFET